MKRSWLILCIGLFLALAGYSALYFAGTSSCASMMRSPARNWPGLKTNST